MALLRPHSFRPLPRYFPAFLFAVMIISPAGAFAQAGEQSQTSISGDRPKDPKAAKTFQTALEWQKRGDIKEAVITFRKAFMQDDGQCSSCLSHAYNLALSIGAYKDAEGIAREWLPLAASDSDKGMVHYGIGACLEEQGILEKKDRFFEDSRDEFQTAFTLNPSLTVALYNLGVSQAHLHQDDEAKAAFHRFLELDKTKQEFHARARRFIERIDLARAKMAPPFSLTTFDGQHVSMDSLAGKVVLIDFWATWCGPCREALPHMRDIARKFEGQPFVMLSISLDNDEKKWKEFVAKNGMTWMQYHEIWSSSKMAKTFNVNEIPATFSIDADGVLEDQHVGDANIDGKLKKMIARAIELADQKPAAKISAQTAGPS